GQVFQAAVTDQAKEQSEDTEQNSDHQQIVAIDAQELDLMQVRELQTSFPGGRRLLGGCKSPGGPDQHECKSGRDCLGPSNTHKYAMKHRFSSVDLLPFFVMCEGGTVFPRGIHSGELR